MVAKFLKDLVQETTVLLSPRGGVSVEVENRNLVFLDQVLFVISLSLAFFTGLSFEGSNRLAIPGSQLFFLVGIRDWNPKIYTVYHPMRRGVVDILKGNSDERDANDL